MAVVSRVTTLALSGGLGSRTWQATADVQDTIAGSAVTITTTMVASGNSPPLQSDQLALDIYIDNGATLVRNFVLAPGAASQASSLSFTVDGVAASAARAGTLRVRLRAQNTSGGATSTYHVYSEGSGNTLPTGFTVTQADQGWVRSTTTVTVAASNVAAGGALPGPTTLPVGATFFPSVFAYPDTIYQRATLAAPAYGAPTLTMSFGALSGLSSPGSQTFDRTHAAVTFSAYLAAVNTVTQTVAASNAALTSLPFTVFTTTTAPDARVDPRLFRESLFQLDDNTFATPPSSKHVALRRRLVTQQAFLADRTLNARGEGQNGITYNIALTPDKPGTPVTATGLTTVTQGGLAGYSSSFTAWQSSLPSGIWRKTVALTAPAATTPVFDSTGTARYVLGVDATETGMYTLISPDPNIAARMNVRQEPGFDGRHFSAGMALIPTVYLVNIATGLRVMASAITFTRVTVVRGSEPTNLDGTGNGWEYLDATLAWNPWDATEAQATHALIASAADITTFEKRFATDTTWGLRDIRFNAAVEYEGVLYSTDYIVVNVGAKNKHDTPDIGPLLGLPL